MRNRPVYRAMNTTEMIYIVDDAADYRFLLQQVFTHFIPDYSVRFFPSGDALGQHVRADEARPRLVLLDLNMPGLSGYQTLTLLKARTDWKHVPVVMMSHDEPDEELRQCYEAGASSFLIKPTDFNELKDLMQLTGRYWLGLNRQPVYDQPATRLPESTEISGRY